MPSFSDHNMSLKQNRYIIRTLLIRGAYDFLSAGVLCVFGLTYLLLSLLASAVALPTDLIIPNLIIGAVLGRLWGLLTVHAGFGSTKSRYTDFVS